jgi:hypothetical protein
MTLNPKVALAVRRLTGKSRMCETCGAEGLVTDSRPTENAVRRRRQCPNCGRRWTTFELTEEQVMELGISAEAVVEAKGLLVRALKELGVTLGAALVALCVSAAPAPAQQCLQWGCGPDNWANSPDNFANTPLDWQNSPMNWNNSALNPMAPYGIYDNNGDRLGYGVPTPGGGMNIFDNEGNREGYLP